MPHSLHQPIPDFDQPHRRQNSDSIKWQRYRDSDVIPMWIADMDFASPPAVTQALQERVSEGVFGYGISSDALTESLCQWYQQRHQWTIDPASIVWLPGLVCGLHAVTRAFVPQGESLITHTPVYPPFLQLTSRNQNTLQAVPMKTSTGPTEAGQWQLDLEAMQQACTPETRMLMFCNPHNPTGRVFTAKELEQISQLCLDNQLLICSDEIHCDLILDQDKHHIPIATLNPQIAARSITLIAPSKTFNIAGLACSAAIIPDPDLRRQFRSSIRGLLPEVNILGRTAAEAAYREGAPWLEQLLNYLRENRQLLIDWVRQQPSLNMASPEATYLGWIDYRAQERTLPARDLLKQTGVALSEGKDFGLPGFARINFGCPRDQLREALTRMENLR